MILIIGSSGYIGSEFCRQLSDKSIKFISISHKDINKKNLFNIIRSNNITHIINCAAFVGKPNIEACEKQKDKCIYGNILLPSMLKNAAEEMNIIFCHISTGCLYNGNAPKESGWEESDEPNFTFDFNNCSFYTGTKVMSENIAKEYEKSYIWRIRLPFENVHNERNYISKIINYDNLITNSNSLSNKQEFTNACIESIEKQIPFGTYNITNSGHISAEDIVNKLKQTIFPNKKSKFLTIDEFYKKINSMPRSNCILNNKKILSFGIKMSEVNESIDNCLKKWQWK